MRIIYLAGVLIDKAENVLSHLFNSEAPAGEQQQEEEDVGVPAGISCCNLSQCWMSVGAAGRS